MERVAIYLRKSRADVEAEARGEGETLAKHKKALLKLAKEKKLNITRIREEIASGESLMHRPEMLELLKEVEAKEYDAVLVMDMDRLGRGNMQEQGLILETFRKSGTKIITPRKTYDLNDEWDEEYTEFETFMARRELKLITRRMQGGRIRSVEEGNYIGTRPPYGYIIKELENGRTLEPHPEQAPVVQLIFNLYTSENMGGNKIAHRLNELGHKTYEGKKWTSASVLNVLKNAVYAGRIQWGKKEYSDSDDPAKRRLTKTRDKPLVDVQGKHEPLVSMELFLAAQDKLKSRYHVPYQLLNGITNPLAGIVKCDMCDSSMVYRPYTRQKPHLMCYNQLCQNKSSRFEYVEEKLIQALKNWLKEYKAQWGKHKPDSTKKESILEIKQQLVRTLENEMEQLEQQKERLHDFLERGIYDEETYLQRSQNLAIRIKDTANTIEKAQKELEEERQREKAQKDIIPQVEHVLSLYEKTDDPEMKNSLLKSVLDKATYRKEKWQRDDDFTLVLYTKVPK